MKSYNSNVGLIKHMLAKRKLRLVVLAGVVSYLVVVSLFGGSKISLNYLEKSRNLLLELPTTSNFNQSKETNLKILEVQNGRDINDLRQQLAFSFPYEPEKPIPRNVWQTWKCGRDAKKFPPKFKKLSDKWYELAKDAHYTYNIIPDDYLEVFLTNLYGEIPLVIDAFKMMPVNILKADFLRYLILYARGGIYSDMDTIPLKPLDSWPSVNGTFLNDIQTSSSPISYKNKNNNENVNENQIKQVEPGFVVGIEADPDREDWSEWYARRIQFCQWTIQSKPGHPILRELILNITATTLNSVDLTSIPSNSNLQLFTSSDSKKIKKMINTDKETDYNVNYRDKRRFDKKYQHSKLKNKKNVDGTDIMNWTGPGIFSDIIFEYLNNIINHNKDIQLFNGNMFEQPTMEKNELEETQTTRRFYKEITHNLLNDNHIPWLFFSLIQEPVMVDDVMVLPITSFSPDVGQMGAKESSDPLAFVKHMFSGSWKESADKNAGH